MELLRLNLRDSNEADPTRDEICKSCTPKRFCEKCLRNGILLSSSISESNGNYSKRTIAQKPTAPNAHVYATNIYEYNLHLLAAICVLEDEKIAREPKYTPPDLIPENQGALAKQQVITTTTTSVSIDDGHVLSSKDEFGIFSQSKYRKLKMHREIGSFSQAQWFCLTNNEDIIVVDKNIHRIKVFDKNGLFKLGFGKFGRNQGQLFYPHRVEAMPDGRIIVCDRGMRLQIFDCFGNFEKEVLYINNDDSFISFTITYDGKIVALSSSSIVLIITEHGQIVQSFCCNDFVTDAWQIITNGPYIYICDFKGHGVVVFDRYGNYQHKIGNYKDTPYPTGIDIISSNGAILVSGCHLSRYVINSFTTTGMLISNFTLPNQIRRTSGLKVTKDGLIITLDKYSNRALAMKAFTTNNLVSSQ